MPPQKDAADGSTDYGSIQLPGKGGEEQEPLVPPSPSHFDVTSDKQYIESGRRQKRFVWFVAGAFGLVGLGSFAIVFNSLRRHTHSKNGKSIRWHGSGGKDLNQHPLRAPDDAKFLGLTSVHREWDASPSKIWGNKIQQGSLPTNSWYLNLVAHRAEKPDEASRAYTVPYIVDTAAATETNLVGGIRVHWPVMQASTSNIQMVNDFHNALVLGTTDKKISSLYQVDQEEALSLLGVTLTWGEGSAEAEANSTSSSSTSSSSSAKSEKTHTRRLSSSASAIDSSSSSSSSSESVSSSSSSSSKASMSSPIVRGMPYASMIYKGGVLPTIYSYNGPAGSSGNSTSSLLADGKTPVKCGTLEGGVISGGSDSGISVQKEMTMHFINSDFTWVVFFSQPVKIVCGVTEGDEKTAKFQMDVVSVASDEPVVVRVALVDQCTTGETNIKQHCAEREEMTDREGYIAMLRNSSHIMPTTPVVNITYPSETDKTKNSYIHFDWAAVSTSNKTASDLDGLVMFAMPHHQEQLTNSTKVTKFCTPTFHGKTCLVTGSKWSLMENVTRPQSFNAPRPPDASTIPAIAKALQKDIQYELSDNMLRGAADTYFSAKILGRVARTIQIAFELRQLAGGDMSTLGSMYDDADEDSLKKAVQAASSANLPSESTVMKSVEMLKKGVSVWLDGAEAQFLYDKSWGGLVNCGCSYSGKDSHGYCNNTFPTCPALASVNEDFGNGYYNDHHYHYGYNVYAAAVVAKYDPEWAAEYFSKILLYIRDFANPFFECDEYFTPFRHKDWYLGSSWASGIVSAENSPHGRNEESSSEAIAAYEGMALYGQVMADVLKDQGGSSYEIAKVVRDAGELLTVTEAKAANRYWHVWRSDSHNSTYPTIYEPAIVGMLHETMASFQTWFSNYGLVSYGIQIMPFTPVAEIRDDPVWAKIAYPDYKKSCEEAGDFCVDNGWSILQAGLCATAGDKKGAVEQALAVPEKVYKSDGGSGNSLTNTLWYISTRKDVTSGGSS